MGHRLAHAIDALVVLAECPFLAVPLKELLNVVANELDKLLEEDLGFFLSPMNLTSFSKKIWASFSVSGRIGYDQILTAFCFQLLLMAKTYTVMCFVFVLDCIGDILSR